jgi:hypothetical protein
VHGAVWSTQSRLKIIPLARDPNAKIAPLFSGHFAKPALNLQAFSKQRGKNSGLVFCFYPVPHEHLFYRVFSDGWEQILELISNSCAWSVDRLGRGRAVGGFALSGKRLFASGPANSCS